MICDHTNFQVSLIRFLSLWCVWFVKDDSFLSNMECRYIETLKGRKRFLGKIKFGSNKEKAKAQRQAVNSICQVVENPIHLLLFFP